MSIEGATVTKLAEFKKEPISSIKLLLFSILGVVGLTVVGLIYYWFIYSTTHISTDNAFIEADLAPVNSRNMGFVREVLAAENEHVEKGQLLVVFDDADLKIEYQFKKAKLDKASSDFKRAQKLLRSHALSAADFEGAKANLAANTADYDGTLLKMQFTRITAPATGIIGKRNVQPGQFVQPGQGLFVIVPDKSLWLKANYKETQVEKVRPGMKVEIKVDAYPKMLLYGHVDSISPTSGSKLSLLPPENASGNFTKIVQRIPVKVKFDSHSSNRLRPGMSASSTIILE